MSLNTWEHAIRMLFNGEEIPQNCPLPWMDPDPHVIHGYLGPPHSTCLTPSPRNLPSPQGSRSIIPILYYGTAPSPPQNCHFPWGDPDPHLIHGDCGPPHPTCQTASRSVQPFLQDISSLHHRQTDTRTDTRNNTWTTPHYDVA